MILQILHFIVLGITALIVYWYTRETFNIRRLEEEKNKRSKLPIVACNFFIERDNFFDLKFAITNLSDYNVAVRINCSFEFDEKPINIIVDKYSFKKYWNLQYGETKYGHLNWESTFFKISRDISIDGKKKDDDRLDRWEDNTGTVNEKRFKIIYDVYCENEFKMEVSYPPVETEIIFNMRKGVYYHKMVTEVTSDNPYWEFEKRPKWSSYRPETKIISKSRK